MKHDPYKNLALAIICQAIDDYRDAWKKDAGIIGQMPGYGKEIPGAWIRGQIRYWTKTEDFDLLSGDVVSSRMLLSRLSQIDHQYEEVLNG